MTASTLFSGRIILIIPKTQTKKTRFAPLTLSDWESVVCGHIPGEENLGRSSLDSLVWLSRRRKEGTAELQTRAGATEDDCWEANRENCQAGLPSPESKEDTRADHGNHNTNTNTNNTNTAFATTTTSSLWQTLFYLLI